MTHHVLASEHSVAGVPERRKRGEQHISSARPACPPVLTTKVALELPTEMAYEEWERAGSQLSGLLSSSSWWLGDWLTYGKKHYRGRYERGVQAAGLTYQTLRNYAWVAGRFPPDRRRPALSFQHHAEVASHDIADQERWLQEAQDRGWSVRRLRTAMREARGDGTSSLTAGEQLERLAVPGDRLRRWHEAATQAGTDVEKWVISTLDNAAEEILTD